MPRIRGNKIDPIKFEALRIRQNRELVHRHEHCDRAVRLEGIILLTAPRNGGRPGEMRPDSLPRIDDLAHASELSRRDLFALVSKDAI